MVKALILLGAFYFLSSEAAILSERELKQLRDAPMVPIQSIGNGPAMARSLEDTVLTIKKKCTCHGKTCGCCTDIEVSFFTVQGCVNITIIPEAKAFEVFLEVADNSVFKQRVSAHQLEKVCGGISKLKESEICLYTTLDEDKPDELLSCMALDMSYHEIPLVNINFECLKYADKKLTFVPNEKTHKDDALVNFKVKNPFHLIAKLLKALVKKLDVN
uniref:Venom protein family 2 protein 4 n=1 Tax=Pristhesancus plagipennis TaxID=1955184 RepID=A0A1Q1NPB9_PRIPG|nr:venom protein family 2 protein 4 [Pristhesancus plagipennis]